jgi:MIF4G domain/MA3 domain
MDFAENASATQSVDVHLNLQANDISYDFNSADSNDWAVVRPTKPKRSTSMVAIPKRLPQLPSGQPTRTQSNSVRRQQSGDLSSLQQEQVHTKNTSKSQKLPVRSQSLSVPQRTDSLKSTGHGTVTGNVKSIPNNRRGSKGGLKKNPSSDSMDGRQSLSGGKKGKASPARSMSYAGQGSGSKPTAVSFADAYRPKSLDEISLLNTNGTGSTLLKQQVIRCSAELLLSQRLFFTDAPLCWTPHDRCHWQAPDRILRLEQENSLFHNFKPLKINDETRWKSKAISRKVGIVPDTVDQVNAKLASITAILNKLSWTNLDKLTVQFIEALGADACSGVDSSKPLDATSTTISQDLIKMTMSIVVEKAMLEPHFAELYARLSVRLAAIHKTFKRIVLYLCQEQFELTGKLDEAAPLDSASVAETTQNKKKSIGLMKFIGELYVMNLIKSSIMISCCERLLCPTDEEKLESFCKLMTSIGKKLQEENREGEPECRDLWSRVYCMAGKVPMDSISACPTAPSTRIKFLLQALVELKENNWVQIRHVHEKAQTIAQIHAQIAEETKRGPLVKTASATMIARSKSSGMVSKHDTLDNPKQTSANNATYVPNKRKSGHLRRSKSEAPGPSSSLQKAMMENPFKITPDCEITLSVLPETQIVEPIEISLQPSNQCREKAKNLLNEFFVSGDRGEAISLIDEIVLSNTPGHLERGALVVKAGIFLVLEMKEQQVRQFLDVISKCLDDQKLVKECLSIALEEPLDCIWDIEIDAPLAVSLLAAIIADWLKKKLDEGETALSSLDFLLKSSNNFRTGGRPALFAVQILKQKEQNLSDDELKLVEEIMTEEEKTRYGSVQVFVSNCFN